MDLACSGLAPEVLPDPDVIPEFVWMTSCMLGDIATDWVFDLYLICFLEWYCQ